MLQSLSSIVCITSSKPERVSSTGELLKFLQGIFASRLLIVPFSMVAGKLKLFNASFFMCTFFKANVAKVIFISKIIKQTYTKLNFVLVQFLDVLAKLFPDKFLEVRFKHN